MLRPGETEFFPSGDQCTPSSCPDMVTIRREFDPSGSHRYTPPSVCKPKPLHPATNGQNTPGYSPSAAARPQAKAQLPGFPGAMSRPSTTSNSRWSGLMSVTLESLVAGAIGTGSPPISRNLRDTPSRRELLDKVDALSVCSQLPTLLPAVGGQLFVFESSGLGRRPCEPNRAPCHQQRPHSYRSPFTRRRTRNPSGRTAPPPFGVAVTAPAVAPCSLGGVFGGNASSVEAESRAVTGATKRYPLLCSVVNELLRVAIAAQYFSERTDVEGQAVFLNDRVGPDALD